MGETLPVAVRATVVTRKRRSLIFGRTHLSYDVRFKDGKVQQDVNIDAVLQGARFPADYHTVVDGAKAVAGDGVPGEWVDYPYGRPLRD
ncbi:MULTISPECIES: hypothetical protein [Cryobacterium]|uniref:hypothetical protein n=1 Tax=Cryobacterium TaxID=69578 RepID=UPI00105725D3|nr:MULTISPECIES: hypothetical protein [Cryobacterium]TFC45994.1 hypothetical protein E3O57_07470 [Cryobacterium sp. TMN-39-2]